MYWGILVDTNGDGFQAGSYLSFGSILIPQFLSTPSGITDDYWVGSTNPTFTAAALPDGGLPGTINLITNVPVYDAENPCFPIQVNDLYGLMWFSAPPLGINASTDTVADIGDKYGFYQNAGLQITSASGSIDNSGIFAGADPVRNTGAENGPPTNPTGTGYTIIPEPSVVSLLLSLLPLAIVGRLRRHGPVGSRNP